MGGMSTKVVFSAGTVNLSIPSGEGSYVKGRNTISFTTSLKSYQVWIQAYNNDGTVEWEIISQGANSFVVDFLEDCTAKYFLMPE
jgi:hypothetical protein